MSAIAAAIKHMMAAGMEPDAIVAAVAEMEAAAQSQKTKRQGRNARYYASKKRLKASYSDVSDAHSDVSDAEASYSDALVRVGAGAPLTPSEDIKTYPSDRQKDDANRETGEEAVRVLRSLPDLPDTAAACHAAAMVALQQAGFTVAPEFHVPAFDGERNGRIDVVLQKNGGLVAIELDARTPRRKSLKKLRCFPGYRIVALRGVALDRPPDGIDAAVSLPVRAATPSEASDKRTVNRPHSLPEDFQVDLAYAEENGITGLRLKREVQQFFNYYEKRQMVDWHKTWKNWVLRSVKWSEERASSGPPSSNVVQYPAISRPRTILDAIRDSLSDEADDPFGLSRSH